MSKARSNEAEQGASFELVRKAVWLFLMLLATATAFLIAWKYPWDKVTQPGFATVKVVEGQWRINSMILSAHIMTALPPLLIGPWLFVRGLLKTRFRVLHVWLGLVYVYCILGSSVLGLALATGNPAGPVATGGFGTLAVVWFTTTYLAFVNARRKDWILHREWMIRSFMITMAVVTVRLLPAPQGEAMSQFYPIMTWLCWVPNAIIAELYVQLTDFRGRINPQKRRELRARRAARAARQVQRDPAAT